MGSGFPAVLSQCHHERSFLIDQRLFPCVHSKQIGIRGDAFHQIPIRTTDGGKFIQQSRINRFIVCILDGGRRTAGNIFDPVEKFLFRFQRQRFQFRKGDVRIFRLGGASQTQRNFRCTGSGMFQQTFINVPDLFHVQCPIREQDRAAGLFQHLQRVQQQENRPVVNGQRGWIALLPAGSLGSSFKERILIRIKDGAAQSRQAHLGMLQATINGPKDRQQTRPGIVPPF